MARKHGPWRVEETTEKHRDPFITVRLDRVIRPDGRPGEYATVDMKPGVAVLPIDEQGNVYLTRQFRYALGRESVEVVCGGVDDGETPRESADREAIEELGVKASDWIDLGYFDLDTSIVNCRVDLFVARDLRLVEARREGTETIETLKVPFEEAARMVIDGRITHGPSCVLILKARTSLD
jgi:8-oxo-dGTP pyrophosphatase MutT (NUDIX family)